MIVRPFKAEEFLTGKADVKALISYAADLEAENERLQVMLREARQYVSDAGPDEDPDKGLGSLVERLRVPCATADSKEAADEIERLRAALELHDTIAELDRKSGDCDLWTDNYREACEATQSALKSARRG